MSDTPIQERVQAILERVPEAAQNPKLLILLYWQAVDGIPIPPDVMRAIIDRGTSPVTINRCRFNKSSSEVRAL